MSFDFNNRKGMGGDIVESAQFASSPVAAGWTEIEALGLLASEADVRRRLHEITSAYGKVQSISKTDGTRLGRDNRINFLVEFDSSQDALVAAQALRCYLYGVSTLLVSVPQNGKDFAQHRG